MTLPPLRIGEGWDTHALVTGRPLVLGGVTIAHTKKGHPIRMTLPDMLVEDPLTCGWARRSR